MKKFKQKWSFGIGIDFYICKAGKNLVKKIFEETSENRIETHLNIDFEMGSTLDRTNKKFTEHKEEECLLYYKNGRDKKNGQSREGRKS